MICFVDVFYNDKSRKIVCWDCGPTGLEYDGTFFIFTGPIFLMIKLELILNSSIMHLFMINFVLVSHSLFHLPSKSVHLPLIDLE